MPRLFLTPFVIAGLLFLPSCSSAEAKACVSAEKAYAEFEAETKKAYKQREISIKASDWNSSKNYLALALKYELWTQKVIVNNPSCFTAAQVVIAQSFVESN